MTRSTRIGLNRTICAAIAAAATLAAPAAAQDAGTNVTNRDITLAIETELLINDRTPAHLVDVRAQNGVVTLTGSVNTMLAKEQAAKVARATRGVESVVNRIDVPPSGRSDRAIRENVQAALLNDAATESFEIDDVDVNDGFVTLTGTVDSWRERTLAEDVAKGVRGVRGVTNDIAVTYTTTRPDREIAAGIRRALEMNPRVDAYTIEVSVEDGVVRLTGTAGSAAEKAEARRLSWVAGVESVKAAGLDVEPWARDEMTRKTPPTRSDAQIERAVVQALVVDPRVASFNPDVEVDDGVVTLTGTVSNLAAKRAAETDARNVVGVRRVHNFLRVRPVADWSDEEIEEDVRQALLRDAYVNRLEIEVDVDNGLVTLRGDVDFEHEKQRAETVASRVPGVIAVENRLRVEDEWTWREDREIREDIQSQLFWSPFVDSDNVTVTVTNGVAHLTGAVDDWDERSAATENAFEGGARSVDNDLKVRME